MCRLTESDFDVLYEDDEIIDESDDAADVVSEVPVSAFDAYVKSINTYGRVNVPFIARTSGLSPEEAVNKLAGVVIWCDPLRYMPDHPEEGWLTREQYLEGNLIQKLREAEEAERKYGCFKDNIRLLRKMLPETPDNGSIHIALGATWIPADIYVSFLTDLLHLRSYPPTVTFDSLEGKWIVYINKRVAGTLGTVTYGTSRMGVEKIVSRTMNAQALAVMDVTIDPITDKKSYVLNETETLAARDKQAAVIQAFDTWLADHPALRQRLEALYAEQFGFRIRSYDGSFLELSDLNPQVSLYRHQKNAIARIILSDKNVLLAHHVGAGKTYEFITGVAERTRIGLSKKAMIVVPNSVLEETAKSFHFLYPNRTVTLITPALFRPKNRSDVLRQIRETETGVWILPFSSFDMIGTGRVFHLQKLRDFINEAQEAADEADESWKRYRLLHRARKAREEANELMRQKEDKPENCFESLGIDLLVVDECQNYKNITILGGTEPVVGMNGQGSARADRMLEKCDCVRASGGKLVFATGTPLTNSLADLFVLQRYLQPDTLKALRINHFGEWLNTFCTRQAEFEVDVSGSGFRTATRIDRFHNLPELLSLFGDVCDFYQLKQDRSNLPEFAGYTNVLVPCSMDQKYYIQMLSERTDAIRQGRVPKMKDNYLKVTTDGRKAALDIRLVNPDEESSDAETSVEDSVGEDISATASDEGIQVIDKVAAAAERITSIYRENPDRTQLVFCDLSTPKAGFNVYSALKTALSHRGIPDAEIAFVHDAGNAAQREKLFRAFRKGEIRVLIGSTMLLGTGVNVQERVVAVHHLDAPWRPADLVQREGRAIRQGNTSRSVAVYRYVTEASFDAYVWQILEAKQRFVASFLSGTLDRQHRDEADIGDLVLDYAEIKALAVGNPLVRLRVETANRLQHARVRAFQARKARQSYEASVRSIPEKMLEIDERIRAIETDKKRAAASAHKRSRSERKKTGARILASMRNTTSLGSSIRLHPYRGFGLLLPAERDSGHPRLYLEGTAGLRYLVDLKDTTPVGVTIRMDNVLDHLDERQGRLHAERQSLSASLADAEKHLESTDTLAEEIASLSGKLEALDKQLREMSEPA